MCLKGNNVQKAMLNEKNTNNKTKLVVSAYLARKQKGWDMLYIP